MDHQYAREKLTLLLRDLDTYSDDEFWRQMSRIAGGATGTDHAEEIAKERDALASHVERLRKAALDAIHYLPGGEIKAELRDAYDDTPETSLARLKAKWQAEVLYEFTHGSYVMPATLNLAMCRRADELRRQAEEVKG